MSNEFPVTNLNRVKRLPKRAAYDKEAVYEIVDAALICHVGMVVEGGRPVVIPTIHARQGDNLLLHGASTSRMLNHVGAGHNICVTVTHLDGLVLARSVFHHSMNYRSAIMYGSGRLLTDPDEKMEALEIFTEKLIPGRWDEARIPNEKELNGTLVIGIDITDASAKIRDEGANDEVADMDLDVWAGVLELETRPTEVVKNADCKEGLETPESVKNFKFSNHSVQ